MMILNLDRTVKTPLYIQIRDRISDLIGRGLLPPGSRLPPTRELADSLGVSRNTVVSAYRELEVSGLISSHVGRGAFVCKYLPRGVSSSGGEVKSKMRFEGLFSTSWTRSYAPLASGMEQLSEADDDPDTISLASALPDRDLFPLGEFRDCLQSAMRRYGADLLTSGPPQGFQPLLDYLPAFLARRGIRCEGRDMMIVNGIQQGLSIVGRLFVDPGDTVILENLTYPGALGVFRSLQANCVGIPVDSEGIRVDILENVLKRRSAKLLYTIPTFQNPTGTVLSAERRERLVELCRENQVVIVEDDYAHELIFEGKEALPLKAWDEWDGIIYMGSFSEILFPGIRLSWILAPRPILERLLLIKQSSDLYTNRILQGALLEFCRRGLLEKHLKRKRLVYRGRRDAMLGAMKTHFPKGISWQKPRGGLFQWVDLPSKIDALSLLLKARERGVVFAPDRIFSVEEWERGGFRLGFASVGEEKIEKGIKILGEILREMLAKEI
ncbi:MAG: MocR-like pyridoxine biosynthesis transcription factor PdxR [bacterium]